MQVNDLLKKIKEIPRVNFAFLPTPLDFLPNMSKELGINLYIKRDDCTGLAFGGNKTRHLEFIMAKTINSDYDCIITGATTQSNWCRQTIAAANKLNLETFLVLMEGIKGIKNQGNYLLYKILGANIDIIKGENLEDIPKHLEIKFNKLKKQGRKPLLLKGGFDYKDTILSAISYVNAMAEIDVQMKEKDFVADHLILSSVNMTQAGCVLGSKILEWNTRVQGFSPVYWDMNLKKEIVRICNQAANKLNIKLNFDETMINNDNNFVGKEYGITSNDGLNALKLLAKKEGVILDTVYTSKAFAGLINYIKKGIIKKNQNVIFLFTGGNTANFAYEEELITI